MKKTKLSAVILSIAIIICTFASCTGDSSEVVISAGETSSADISANMYNYWASTGKANFMLSYDDIEDTDEFWQSEYEDGKTYAEFFDSLLLEDIKTTAVCMMLYNEYRLSIPDETEAEIKEQINEYLTEYAEGNKNTLNSALSRFGANMTILENAKMQEAKRSIVMSYLFGEGGEKELDDEAKEKFYLENYYHFQIIYINNKFEYVMDDDGNYTTNADGSYVTRALTGEKLSEKNNAVEAVKTALDAGEAYDALYEKYSETKEYKNGYYFTAGDSYASPVFYKLIGDIAEVGEGDITISEYDSGTYIMKRLPNDEKAWSDKANADFFGTFEALAVTNSFRTLCKSYFDRLTVNDEIIKNYSVSEVRANSRF